MRATAWLCVVVLGACQVQAPAGTDDVPASPGEAAVPADQAMSAASAAIPDNDGLAPAPAALVGNYSLYGIYDGDPSCSVRLTDGSAIGGWVLELEPACIDTLGVSPDVEVWSVDAAGAIVFMDGARTVSRRLLMSGDGDYVSRVQADGGQDVGVRSLVLQRK